MERSGLTIKYNVDSFNQFIRSYKENYKRNNNENFKGSVLDAITLGIIRDKQLPDIDDVLLLMKAGNFKVPDEQQVTMLQNWLDDEKNKDRGIVGAFCACCTDIVIDGMAPNKVFADALVGLEDTINKQQEAQQKMREMISRLAEFGDKLKNVADKATENETPVEVKEPTVENTEKVVAMPVG